MVDFKPDGLKFLKPARLGLTPGSQGSHLKIGTFDPFSEIWVPVSGSFTANENDMIWAEINHFSLYAVISAPIETSRVSTTPTSSTAAKEIADGKSMARAATSAIIAVLVASAVAGNTLNLATFRRFLFQKQIFSPVVTTRCPLSGNLINCLILVSGTVRRAIGGAMLKQQRENVAVTIDDGDLIRHLTVWTRSRGEQQLHDFKFPMINRERERRVALWCGRINLRREHMLDGREISIERRNEDIRLGDGDGDRRRCDARKAIGHGCRRILHVYVDKGVGPLFFATLRRLFCWRCDAFCHAAAARLLAVRCPQDPTPRAERT